MPWVPELFSAPALQQLLRDRRRDELESVPFFYGLTAGEQNALVESFVGEPELHDPARGRVKGVAAFTAFVDETNEWLSRHAATVEHGEHVITARRRFEENVLHLRGEKGPVAVPVAIVADHTVDGLLHELRLYGSRWPLTGRHSPRPPLLQRDPDLHAPDVVGAFLDALGPGDVDAVVATFAPDGYVRDSEGVHQGQDGLRTHYERVFFSGGVVWEGCAVIHGGQFCALEYNVVARDDSDGPQQAGLAVFVHSDDGKLAAVRLYDDLDPVGYL